MDDVALVEEIGDALRTARSRRGLSQRDLADYLEITKSSLARLESGEGASVIWPIQRALRKVGFSLTVVDEEADQWGHADRAWEHRDVRGRRFPAHAVSRYQRLPPWYWCVKHPRLPWSAGPKWTWRRQDEHELEGRKRGGRRAGREGAPRTRRARRIWPRATRLAPRATRLWPRATRRARSARS